ncbi:hypothetical protein Bhyg_02084, partial [Pseudolycoriella hygida]
MQIIPAGIILPDLDQRAFKEMNIKFNKITRKTFDLLPSFQPIQEMYPIEGVVLITPPDLKRPLSIHLPKMPPNANPAAKDGIEPENIQQIHL